MRTGRVIALIVVIAAASFGFVDLASAEPDELAGGACDPNYDGACVPIAPGDVINCENVPERNFRVVGVDVYNLDNGGTPGLACEDPSLPLADLGSAPVAVAGATATAAPADPAAPTDALAKTGANSLPMASASSILVLLGLLLMLLRERRNDVHYVVIRSKTGRTWLVPKARRFQ